jgi:hypothetical protein
MGFIENWAWVIEPRPFRGGAIVARLLANECVMQSHNRCRWVMPALDLQYTA